MKWLYKLFGDPHKKTLRRLQPLVNKINALEIKYAELSDEELKNQTVEFKKQIAKGKTLDDLLPDAFAVVREASKRSVGMRHFDVQLVGGMVLYQGKIAEMKTGEGKTLVATLPAYLYALSGLPVHIVTVNDYLAKRDAHDMGQIYAFLDMTTSAVYHGQDPRVRKECYEADIVYATNNELGFDYLRDNMSQSPDQMVQRQLGYAIVDEVDSILIDEARTPLIISAPAEESTSRYQKYSRLIPNLIKDKHYTIDEKMHAAVLTEEGIRRMEEMLGIDNLFTAAGFVEVHHIEQALKAHTLYKNDVDYIVQNGEIIIVDEFTGRLMPGRRYSDGLHQAIEAKENVAIKQESKTLASITFQNFFRLYQKLAGMTGTAETESEEFYQIYGLDVVVIPTNQKVMRLDQPDNIYKTALGKFQAITKIVKAKHEHGQPVLVGTASIETSELLSKLFEKANIPHRVLNAKQHEKEAEIVAQAGQLGAITIATNMAGRGTDIKLGAGVSNLGGLCIIGSERHEARRIDNQLRGRSGRQGDPGESQFFISMEDNLMRIFGGDRVKAIMNFLRVPEDMPIRNRMVSRSIEAAQRKIEGYNFDLRKHVLEYDDVLAKQRNAVYRRRRFILEHANVGEKMPELFTLEATNIVKNNFFTETNAYNHAGMMESVKRLTQTNLTLHGENEEAMITQITKHFQQTYETKKTTAPSPEIFQRVEKTVYLRSIDSLWMEHIDDMANLRNDVALYGYGQRNPLIEYKKEAYLKCQQLLANVQTATLQTLFHIEFQAPVEIKQEAPQYLETNAEEIEGSLTSSVLNRKANTTSSTRSLPKNVNVVKVGRNDLCYCGSGKKFKKCHGA